MTPTWTSRATVVRVIDGDTFDAEIDLGWGIWLRKGKNSLGRIRIFGWDAPELGTPEGEAAKVKAEALLPVGTKVWLASHDLDHFDRCLATVTFDDGRDFVTEMTK